MTASSLLALHIRAKLSEQAARRALGDALAGPSPVVPFMYRSWRSAAAAEKAVLAHVRRTNRCPILPFAPRAA